MEFIYKRKLSTPMIFCASINTYVCVRNRTFLAFFSEYWNLISEIYIVSNLERDSSLGALTFSYPSCILYRRVLHVSYSTLLHTFDVMAIIIFRVNFLHSKKIALRSSNRRSRHSKVVKLSR